MPDYMMGHSEWELARLRLQASILEPITCRILEKAGLRPGMRVLDIGCGTGEVSALIAERVGPHGHVVGLDRSPVAIEHARKRFGQPANLLFEAGTPDNLPHGDAFDLVFGRYVLMHQPDPPALLRQVAAMLRPGGTLAFHEIVLSDGFPTSPPSPLWNRMNGYFTDAFRSGLRHFDLASRLVACFTAAGLGAPRLLCECVAADAATSPVTSWFAETLRTLLPDLVRSFQVDEAEFAIDTLAARLGEEARTYDIQVCSSRQVGAWLQL